ncbi:MAG TPA: homospermidine synthase [Vulgatibacter sp.]
MSKTPTRALIIGANGGVGRAVVSLLRKSAPGSRLLSGIDELFLADREPVDTADLPANCQVLPPVTVDSPGALERLVREYRLTQVVDLSSIDTIDATRICDEAGANFLCTSIEEWPGAASTPTDEAIARLKPPHRPELPNRRHLVGSGANPGIVNALVFAAMEEFARRVGVEPTIEALELHSILVTEEDTTREPGVRYDDDVFPMTWSPAHCLEELFEPRAFVARQGAVVDLPHRPTERTYRVRCGDRLIDGMVVPHEETKTLAWGLAGVEFAFVYRIPDAARRALSRNPSWDANSPWRHHRLVPPASNVLEGEDRVGVLLCSRRFGELWLGFSTDVEKGLPYGTNATQLQVAAGVLAGWMQLSGTPGIHFVEDLDRRRFLDVAAEILGRPVVFHDRAAPALMLEERVVPRRRKRAAHAGAPRVESRV